MEIDRLQVLRTDASGMPMEWIGYQEAAKLYHLGHVVYCCGSTLFQLRGGFNALSGRLSRLDINSIIATRHGASSQKSQQNDMPPLNNPALFRRDNHCCLYCGQQFPSVLLSRDHITPLSQRGEDAWGNVVTACKRCNNHKAGRTPEQAGLQLLAIPFTPTHAEYIYLQGRTVLSDQMEFLKAHFPRKSPLRQRMS